MLYDLGFHSSHFFVASIARKFYKHSGIGIDGLRQIYGGPKRRGAKPNKAVLGSGAVMRSAIKQLEILKVIEKDPKGYVFFLCVVQVVSWALCAVLLLDVLLNFCTVGAGFPTLGAEIWTELLHNSPLSEFK